MYGPSLYIMMVLCKRLDGQHHVVVRRQILSYIRRVLRDS